MPTYVELPPALLTDASRWLDEIEATLGHLMSVVPTLSAAEAAALRAAVQDVQVTTAFARDMICGRLPLDHPTNTQWVPLANASPALAAAIHASGGSLSETPWPLIQHAKLALTDDQHSAFVRVVGDVLGSVFTNLTRAVWNNYPAYAPDGWES
jgi:hypothetical protein